MDLNLLQNQLVFSSYKEKTSRDLYKHQFKMKFYNVSFLCLVGSALAGSVLATASNDNELQQRNAEPVNPYIQAFFEQLNQNSNILILWLDRWHTPQRGKT